ncbi:cilia- and flagella-associated protein 251 [Aedes aegypti]|uniref:Uncharacterized protein n=1 Tax=Aedes aegypti TaxID=7159 RepID=A0A1S4FEH4_AEDAE|nr:cilia- and flagella-associated protein 251 [Aedes aegypti]
MFKIATVLILVAAIAIHAAPQGRRDSDFRRTDVGALEPERDEWQYEDVPNENQLENGQRGIRKAFWQYEIAHIQPNKKGSRAGNGSIREEQNSQEETQPEEQNENEEEQEAEEPQSEEQGQENEETVEEQDQLDVRQDRVRSEGRRQNSGRGSNERNGRRGRVDQQRSRGRQEGRQGGRQEGRQGRRQEESRESNQQSSEEAEQTNEPEDQIQVEQEGLEEVNQEAPQNDSQENTESKGIADYEYTYGVNDPATGDHKDHWEKRVGDHVEGGYILEQPDGKRRVVKYESGKKGFETNIMQIERKKGHKKTKNAKKQKSVAHSYASVKQNN